MHYQVTSLLNESEPDLPLFLFAHSMGCCVLNTYLNMNPEASRSLSGVIYEAPMFGPHESIGVNPVKRLVMGIMANTANEFVFIRKRELQKITTNRTYLRHLVKSRVAKTAPMYTASFVDSCFENTMWVQNDAKLVKYPYLMVLGEKDETISNPLAKAWHAKTSSKIKGMRLIPGAYHELTKETNNHMVFESVLKFMGERLTSATT